MDGGWRKSAKLLDRSSRTADVSRLACILSSALMPTADSRERYSFRGFELDVPAYEMRRDGGPIRLERQPMDLLILLLERRGYGVSSKAAQSSPTSSPSRKAEISRRRRRTLPIGTPESRF